MAKQVINDFNAGEIKGSFRRYVESLAREIKESSAQAKEANDEKQNKSAPSNTRTTEKGSSTKPKPEKIRDMTPGVEGLNKLNELVKRSSFLADLLAATNEVKGETFKELLGHLDDAEATIRKVASFYKAEQARHKQEAGE